MKTNLFMNPYQQPENKLTYNFLSMVELTNDKDFLVFLTNQELEENPIVSIETVFGGGKSNPDGCITLINRNKNENKIYLEIKTNRRGISKEQLLLHLELLSDNDKLLVITPRLSDRAIINEINNNKIIFISWIEISEYLKNNIDNYIVRQFIEYGKLSGEFDELGEITNVEIKNHVENLKIDFDKRINSIFYNFSMEYDFSSKGFKKIETVYSEKWGRRGVEINYRNDFTSYDQWWAISYYYDIFDHNIKFKKDIPEIVFFFDIGSKYSKIIRSDEKFIEIVNKLEENGFESNLNKQLTNNSWRLLVYRKPITDFDILNINEIRNFTDNIFLILNKCGAFEHKYFNEFM